MFSRLMPIRGNANSRISLTVLISVGSKLVACFLQFISIPLGIQYLGIEGYAEFVALLASSLLLQAFVFRFGPMLTGPTAYWVASGHWKKIRDLFWAATSLVIGSLLLVILLAALACFFTEIPDKYAGSAFHVFAILTILNLFSTSMIVVEDLQAGLLEAHVHGVRSMIGNLVALVCITCLFPMLPSLLSYSLCLMLPMFLVRSANVLFLLQRYRKELLPQSWYTAQSLREAASGGAWFTVVVGLGAYVSNQLPLVFAGAWLEAADIASVAVVHQLTLISFAFGSAVVVGYLPYFQTKLAQRDREWLTCSLTFIERLFLLGGTAGIVSFILVGPVVCDKLLGGAGVYSPSYFLFSGFYASALIVENFFYLLTASSEHFIFPNAIYLVRALAIGVASALAIAFDFPQGVWCFGFLVLVFSTIPIYRTLVWKRVSDVEVGAV